MEPFDQLKQQWKQEKTSQKSLAIDANQLIQEAKNKKSQSISAHVITIIVLSITLICLIAFFKYVAPFKELLSRAGVLLMCGGLLLRIVIEFISLRKSRILTFDNEVRSSANAVEGYYNYRIKIHGALTYSIVAAYIIGFYMLTPEFMQYLALKWVLLMDIGFVIIAIVMIVTIRKGVLQELSVLKRIKTIAQNLNE